MDVTCVSCFTTHDIYCPQTMCLIQSAGTITAIALASSVSVGMKLMIDPTLTSNGYLNLVTANGLSSGLATL